MNVNAMSTIDKINVVRSTVTLPALLECLAEECSELTQASLKRARILRGENPTPTDAIEAVKNFKEEVQDVVLLLNVLNQFNDEEIIGAKLDRWVSRLEASEMLKEAGQTDYKTDISDIPREEGEDEDEQRH